MKKVLTVTDHNRDIIGLRYIYPVLSRRAKGVSIGINLNTNNACNWRCIYCNVPDLKRGAPEPIDLERLEEELRALLHHVLHGDFMQNHVSPEDRQLKDIAFSGNGEPTSAQEFPVIVELVKNIIEEYQLVDEVKLRLITNGSMMHQKTVINAVQSLAQNNGEVWFKLDAGTQADIARINDINIKPERHLARLKACAAVCPTYIQTCLFKLDGQSPSEAQLTAYLDCLSQVKEMIEGIHLYGIARKSMQPEANRLEALPAEWFSDLAARIKPIHAKVYINP